MSGYLQVHGLWQTQPYDLIRQAVLTNYVEDAAPACGQPTQHGVCHHEQLPALPTGVGAT